MDAALGRPRERGLCNTRYGAIPHTGTVKIGGHSKLPMRLGEILSMVTAHRNNLLLRSGHIVPVTNLADLRC